MILKRIWTVGVALLAVMAAHAGVRGMDQLSAAARQVLQPMRISRGAAPRGELTLLDEDSGIMVFGYAGGGFVVTASNDCFPAVLGYSQSSYSTSNDNPSFRWWMDMVANAMRSGVRAPLRVRVPSELGYASEVKPMVTSTWGQGYPFNMYCPNGFPVGCVATAAAQVLRYNRQPLSGSGIVSTYYPFADYDGTRYEEDIEGVVYVYGMMLDDYSQWIGMQHNEAVGLLTYHIALAMKAQFGSGGTGSYSEVLCHGLRHHFSYPFAVTVKSSDYDADVWMNQVYRTLNEGNPIIYGGTDKDYSGHEFVLSGYDEEGRVFVNWGWSGDQDGYFDLMTLNVYYGMYDFSFYQDMVTGCMPSRMSTERVVVDVPSPGMLEDVLAQRDTIVSLYVKGAINGTDLRTLREMAGSTATSRGTFGRLAHLDLSQAVIVGGGDPYLIEDGIEYHTSDDEIPYKCFSHCSMLVDVRLPSHLRRIGDGVFAECCGLDAVDLPVSAESDFMVDGGYVMSRDGKELLMKLPVGKEELVLSVPQGIEVIHDYAFSGQYLYEWLCIPASVTRIGRYAFNRCFDLVRTYVYASQPPQIDPTAIDDLDLSLRYLYVPSGKRTSYSFVEGWKKYRRQIKEFTTDDGIPAYVLSLEKNARKVYDLQGRVVGEGSVSRLAPGLYLHGGRKFLVR